MFSAISEEIIDVWFGAQSRMSKEDFMATLSNSADKYLTTSSLRQIVRKKVKEMNL